MKCKPKEKIIHFAPTRNPPWRLLGYSANAMYRILVRRGLFKLNKFIGTLEMHTESSDWLGIDIG